MNIIVRNTNIEKKLTIDKDKNLLSILREEGFNIPALCGGNGTCGKCKIKIVKKIPEVTNVEKNHLSEKEINNGFRLACLHKPKDNMIIDIDKEKKYNVVSDFDINKLDNNYESISSKNYGIAVDIGTTTIATSIININTKEVICNKTSLNPQQKYGADVISRIDYINNNEDNVLTKLIRTNIDEAIKIVCETNNVDIIEIDSVVISGNTTMLYILQEYNPYELAVSPFIATHKDLAIYDYNELFSNYLECKVILLPCVSAYIGADITSGMFFLGNEALKHKILFIDLGTNGEIVLSDGKNIYCASAAAGPAFEGACIKDGVGSIDGAICNIEINNKKVSYKTINDKEPVGICGSGIIDVTAEGVKNSMIQKTGRLKDGDIVIANKNNNNICFYQKDVREVQLAKSAIYSGIKVLLDEANLKLEDIEKLYLAGGFGKHINIKNACTVGIIPKELENKTEAIGNSSLGGCVKYLLNKNSKNEVNQILTNCKYIELSVDSRFNDYFMENMSF